MGGKGGGVDCIRVGVRGKVAVPSYLTRIANLVTGRVIDYFNQVTPSLPPILKFPIIHGAPRRRSRRAPRVHKNWINLA